MQRSILLFICLICKIYTGTAQGRTDTSLERMIHTQASPRLLNILDHPDSSDTRSSIPASTAMPPIARISQTHITASNRDGILNDDKYEYDETGYPFFKEVGEIIYLHELERKRTRKPDLGKFRMVYDKPAL